jgi:glycosyltransferase involved in cell wall biosynthesis
VETVVEAVRRLQARQNGPAVHLLAVGIGAQAGWLTRLADGEGAHWLTIRGPCSDAELGEYLTACDASVIALKPGMKGVSVPSRMYNAMAAGRPVLAVADEDSELAMVIQEEEAGWVAPPHDPQALAALIERMIEDPTERARRGAQGRAAVLRSYTLEASLRQWDALLHSIDSASSGSAAGA